MKMYNSLKCCDEETGKCASNLKSVDGVGVDVHQIDAVCWCPSSVRQSIRNIFSGVPSGFLRFIDENVQQFEVL